MGTHLPTSLCSTSLSIHFSESIRWSCFIFSVLDEVLLIDWYQYQDFIPHDSCVITTFPSLIKYLPWFCTSVRTCRSPVRNSGFSATVNLRDKCTPWIVVNQWVMIKKKKKLQNALHSNIYLNWDEINKSTCLISKYSENFWFFENKKPENVLVGVKKRMSGSPRQKLQCLPAVRRFVPNELSVWCPIHGFQVL